MTSIATENTIVSNCAVIILAAGASSRLGRPKQLLPYQGKSLLAHAVDTAIDADADPVIVVLGADAPAVEKEIDEKKVHIVTNTEWKEGMASSIRCGLQTLKRTALMSDAVILMMCDQPYVSPSVLNELIATQKNTGKPIVLSRYGNTKGPPALFYKTLFAELMDLTGDEGARSIVAKHGSDVATVLFEKGNIDIDTEEDYRKLAQ
jgi:molybdenum cofactor cytidylyltransferase